MSKDHTDVVGLGLKKTFPHKIVLDFTYSMTRSSTAVTYTYLNPGGAVLGSPGAPLPDIGNAFPDLTYRLHTLQGSLVVPYSKTISWRFVARYEHLTIYDWHYAGLTPGLLPANGGGGLLPVSFIDLGPTAYHAFIFGIMIQYKL